MTSTCLRRLAELISDAAHWAHETDAERASLLTQAAAALVLMAAGEEVQEASIANYSECDELEVSRL